MTTLATLRAARALISKESNWTQRRSACNARGERLDPADSGAVRWCAAGAILRIGGSSIMARCAGVALDDACRSLGLKGRIEDVNDTTDHRTVLKVFDLAVKRAAEKERKAIGKT